MALGHSLAPPFLQSLLAAINISEKWQFFSVVATALICAASNILCRRPGKSLILSALDGSECYSRSALWTTGVGISATCVTVRNAHSQAPPWIYWIRMDEGEPRGLHFNKLSSWILCMLKLEKPCYRINRLWMNCCRASNLWQKNNSEVFPHCFWIWAGRLRLPRASVQKI